MSRMVTLTAGILALTLAAAPPPVQAIDSFFDVFTELPVTGPPYPTQAIITIVGHDFGGSFQADQSTEIRVADLDLDGRPDVPCRAAGSPTGPGIPPQTNAFFDVFFPDDFTAAIGGRAVVKFVLRSTNVQFSPPGDLLPVNPGAPPGSIDSFFDVFVDDSFFDITYRVADGAGEHTYHAHGVSPSGRMSFFDVFVELPSDPDSDDDGHIDSFFDVFVDFQIAGPASPCCDPTDYCIVTRGSYSEQPVPVVGATWSGIKTLLD